MFVILCKIINYDRFFDQKRQENTEEKSHLTQKQPWADLSLALRPAHCGGEAAAA